MAQTTGHTICGLNKSVSHRPLGSGIIRRCGLAGVCVALLEVPGGQVSRFQNFKPGLVEVET